MGCYSGAELRREAKNYLESAFAIAEPFNWKPPGDAIRSNGPKSMAAKFKELTGMTQEELTKRWEKDSRYTTCGDFVLHYCDHLDIPRILLLEGQPETFCQNAGKGIAWIPNQQSVSPKDGDVFYESGNHVGVSMEYDGSSWLTAEGGQGGKDMTFDMVMRKTRSLSSMIQGWVDLELWDACKLSQSMPVPQWLLGFWKVYWQGQEYYYYFASDRRVRYCNFLELAATLVTPGGSFGSEGRFVVNEISMPNDAVIIRWDDGLMERFRFVAGSNPAQMHLRLYDELINAWEDPTPSLKLEWTDIPSWPYPVL